MDFNERTTALLQRPLSPLTSDSVLRECDAIEADNPYIPSGFLWAVEYKRFQVEIERGNTQVALAHLRRAINLVPYNEELQKEYSTFCRNEVGVEFVAMIVTSKQNEERALALAHQFDTAQMEYVIVSGNDSEPIHHPRAIQVGAKDNYESQGRKTTYGLTWIYENISAHVCVLKVADTMVIENPVALHNAMTRWREQDAYAGVPMSMGNEHDRCRHWGRCEDKDLNSTVYARPYYRPWAEGDAYFLASGPFRKAVFSLMRFPAQLDGEYYEDKLIGDVLMFEGVNLVPLENYTDVGLNRITPELTETLDNQRIIGVLQATVSPFSCDYLLRECDAIESESPQIPSHFRWTLAYRRFQVEASRGNMGPARLHLKKAIALAPFNRELIDDYQKYFANKTSQYRNVMLLISCKKYEQKALQLARQFDDANIEYLIITGNDTLPIVHERALQVDAPDNYESLPRKVAAACAWVVENLGTNVGVLKVDDDQYLFDAPRLKAIVDNLHQRDAYAGVPVSGVTHDRNWHWNKCQNKALSKISYGRPFLRQWAKGGAYYLAPGPLYKLVLTLTRFPGLLESEYYEDKMVGDTLIYENVNPLHLQAYEDFGLTLTEQHRFNKN